MNTPQPLFVIFLCFVSVSFVYSQSVEITGKVIDDQGQPLSYANVILMQTSDSTFVTGTSTNDIGKYTIATAQGDYILEVSFIGFNTVSQTISATKDSSLKDIVLMASSEALEGVKITAQAPTIKKQSDRLIFNVENTALSQGSIRELLQNTPGVIVTNNDILIRNNSATVYINGRKRHLSTPELLQLLENTTANNVKAVEVITRPSAKYDANDGVVLSIQMGENLITGYRGSVFSNYTQGVFPRMQYGTSNFFKKGKLSFNINYTYAKDKIDRETYDEINFIENNKVDEIWRNRTDRNQHKENHDITANLDYEINESNTLSLATNLNFQPYFKYKTLGFSEVFMPDNTLDYYFNSKNISRDVSHNLSYDLDYQHVFKDQSTLKTNTHYTNYKYNRNQNVNSTYFNPSNQVIDRTAFNTDALQGSEIFTSQIDFETMFSETATFSAGIKGSFTNTNNNLEQFDEVNGTLTRNDQNSDIYTYEENIYAAYINYTNTFGKFDFTGGLRVENTQLDGDSKSTSISTNQDYTKWFPTLSLGYPLSEAVYLVSGYKRVVERPAYNELNPFRYFITDNTVFAGNPLLQPAFDNQFTFEISVNQSYVFEAYYSNKKGAFYEIPLQDNQQNLQIFTPLNIGETNDYGLYMIHYRPLTKWWFSALEAVVYHVEDKAVFNNLSTTKHLWTFYVSSNNNFRFLKDQSLTASFLARYIHDQLSGLRRIEPRFETQLSVSKTLFKNKATISLTIADLFNDQDYNIRTQFLNQNSNTFFNQDTRYVKVGFTYKFGNTHLKTNEKIKENEARKRLKGLN